MNTTSLPIAGANGDVYIPVPRRPDAGAVAIPAQPPNSGEAAITGSPAWRAVAWVVPAIVTMAAASVGITGPGLWADELATWGMTGVSWPETWRQLGGTDATLGAYYVFMHLWCAVFGDSDLALRVPSVLAMAGAAAVVGRIGTRLLSARGGLVAGLLFAVLPVTARFAQEARPYAMAVFFAAVATLLLVRLLDGRTFPNGLAYALCLTVLCYVHLIGGLLVVAHGLAVWILQRPMLWRWIRTAVLGIIPVLPLVVLGRRQSAQTSWIEKDPWGAMEHYVQSFFGSALLTGAVLIIGLVGLGRQRASIVGGAVALIPTATLLAVGTMIPLWQQRYILFTVIGWVLLVATALERRGTVVVLAVSACLAAAAIPGQREVRTPAERLQDTKAAVALINRDFRPGDGIVYGLTDRGPGVLNRDIIAHYLPAERRPKDLLVQRPMRTAGYMVASECADVARCLGTTRRIWVLRLGIYPDPIAELDGTKTTVLRRDYTIAGAWQTTGLTIALLQRNGGS
ncbi:mannosyltransferase [Krasilnikovia cinnamomea]|uniref:Mannosyltransferase n=1 Tax=Krasilnikovia cinnamomea TaxID=349313 RepID=A0A4Q7ZDW7_9ACTN|nr:mannosyltransferase [Krasilnikovia cinnamomea]